jgi:hypothetical protein
VTAAPAARPAPAPPPRIPAPAWDARTDYVYQLELASRMDVGAQGARVDFSLAAELRLAPYQAEADRVSFRAELRNPRLQAGSGGSDAQYAGLAKALERPFLFTLASGRLAELRVPTGQQRFAVSIAQTAVAALQFSADEGTSERWTSREHDPTGTFVAAYQAGPGGRFTKKKLRYQRFAMATGGDTPLELMPKVVSSEGLMEIVAGRIRKVAAREQVEVAVGQVSPPFVSQTTLALALVREEPRSAPPAWEALAAAATSVTPESPYLEPPRDSDLDVARTGELTFAEALGLAEAQERDPRRNETWGSKNGEPVSAEEKAERQARLRQNARVFFSLMAWIRQEPKNLARAVKAIRKGSPAANVLLDALSSAGTPAAQAALVELMSDARLAPQRRKDAGLSLIRTKAATEETIRALEARLDDPLLSSHAIYGLGSIARRRREAGDARRSSEIVELLLRRLARAGSALEKVEFLRGIANAATPAALPALQRCLDEEKDDSVRRAAVDALALIQRPEIDPLIARYLQEESRVRLAALDAARLREPSDVLAAGIDRVAREATDRQSRLESLRIMERWLARRPELKATLERLAASEPDEMVRRVAQAALASYARTAVR